MAIAFRPYLFFFFSVLEKKKKGSEKKNINNNNDKRQKQYTLKEIDKNCFEPFFLGLIVDITRHSIKVKQELKRIRN